MYPTTRTSTTPRFTTPGSEDGDSAYGSSSNCDEYSSTSHHIHKRNRIQESPVSDVNTVTASKYNKLAMTPTPSVVSPTGSPVEGFNYNTSPAPISSTTAKSLKQDTEYVPSSNDIPMSQAKKLLDSSIGWKNNKSGLQIRVLGVPHQNAKSRVETQIKICLQLVSVKGDKVTRWSHLRLPDLLVAKDKLRRAKVSEDLSNVSQENILDLEAMVVCASDPTKIVATCNGCIQRERKRVRKKEISAIKLKRGNTNNGDNNGDTTTTDNINDLLNEDLSELDPQTLSLEQRKILLFNCGSVVDFSSGDSILPTRLTCYCRHHNEKLGFCVYFVVRDYLADVVATGVSPPIMITDDHKSLKVKGVKRGREGEVIDSGDAEDVDGGVAQQQQQQPVVVKSPSPVYCQEEFFSPEPVDHHHQIKQQQQNEPNTSTNSQIMSRQLSTQSQTSSSSSGLELESPSTSAAASVSRGMPYAIVEGALGLYDSMIIDHGSSSNTDNSQGHFDNEYRGGSVGRFDQKHGGLEDFSFGVGGMSGGSEDEFNACVAENLLSALVNGNLVGGAGAGALTSSGVGNGFLQGLMPTPSISRIIPAEGPMHGGIEVTLLGNGFYEGLTVLFGEMISSPSQLWGTSTMICVLPPSNIPGPVPVTFKEHPLITLNSGPGGNNNFAIFTYKDESEKALMELALQVVGLRMTGRLDDARNVAMRIVNDTASSGDGQGQDNSHESGNRGGSGGGRSHSNANANAIATVMNLVREYATHSYQHSQSSSVTDTETFIINALMSVYNFYESDSENEDLYEFDVEVCRKGSLHRMLHLACIAGMSGLVKFLIEVGADLDARDVNGLTGLHYAFWFGRQGVVEDLLNAGASPYLTSKQGLSCQDFIRMSPTRVGFPASWNESLEDGYESDFVDEEDDDLDEDSDDEYFDSESEIDSCEAAAGVVEVQSPVTAVQEPVDAETVVDGVKSGGNNGGGDIAGLASPHKVVASPAGKIQADPVEAERLLAAVRDAKKLIDPTNESKDKLMNAETVAVPPKDLTWFSSFGPALTQIPTLLTLPVALPALPSIASLPGFYIPGLVGSWLGYQDAVADVNVDSIVPANEKAGFKNAPAAPGSDVNVPSGGIQQIASPFTSPVLAPSTVPNDKLAEVLQQQQQRQQTQSQQLAPLSPPLLPGQQQQHPTSSHAPTLLDATAREPQQDQERRLPDLMPPLPPPITEFDTLDLDLLDEESCDCQAWSSGCGYHEESCRKVRFALEQRAKKRSRDRAVILFWFPLFLAMFCLAMFRLIVSNEEMDALLDKVVTAHVDMIAHLRDVIHGLKVRGGDHLFLEVLNRRHG
ncbi:hypothetical protein HDU76_004152 [Blyttiomyces sp. JEL0837]|nr:hypothetical protein HDU76_004152 [Blyttiomyces sp. JEL0837]